MTGVNKIARSSAAAGANTDTSIFTPVAGQRVRILSFTVVTEGAAQAAGMSFELRYPAAGTVLAVTGLDSAAAPIGTSSKPQVVNHELIGDGTSAIVGRNLVALAASSNAAYTIALELTPGA